MVSQHLLFGTSRSTGAEDGEVNSDDHTVSILMMNSTVIDNELGGSGHRGWKNGMEVG